MDNNIKQKIIEYNSQFGIKTEFITAGDVLGYSLGNTIYINESIEQDYERTNKHELLHFYENTEEFEKIKQKLLQEHKDELDEIRSEYELRYYGLYSKEEIKAGVLDNEIVIDMMVDNSSIEYEDGLKIGEEFLGQIQKGLEKKRYLNITLKSNIKNMNLSDWEKIFVLNYYDGQKRTLPQGQDKVEKIRKDIEEYLNELYELDEATMTIDSHSPEVIREYESEIKALKARGEDTSYLESNPERCYEEIAKKYSEQLYAEYKHIVDLIKGLDYDPAFKCMMLRETLTKTYKIDRDKESKEKKTIVKNRKLNESIAGHMILNAETLKFMYENIKNIEEYKNFANLYFAAVEIYKETIAKASGITLEGVDTFDKGKWLKFEGKGTDEEHYLENAKKLAALVQDTTWCTKQLASEQLADGDFYVFIDNEGKPHIAVKTSENQIDEVRGVKNGNAQELEEEYRDIAISFLENNKDIQNGKEWLEKEEWNKRLIEYKRKIDNNEFTIEDMPKFIEDYFKVDYRSHGGKNSNKTALKESLEKIKPILAQYYKCKEEEICTEDVNFKDIDLEVVPYRIIFGDADFSDSKITSLGKLENIGGNACFDYSEITSLGNLKSIGGNANFFKSKVTSLGELHSIVGNADFFGSKVTSLGELERIGGNANFRYIKITSLGKLHSIGRNADFRDSKITSLGELESIGGNADFDYSEITSLGELESIGGNANFDYSKITSLGELESIGGNANFSNSEITSLGKLHSIGGNAYFYYSKITSLGELHSIGGEAIFNFSEITSLGELERIGGNADFRWTKMTSLGKLHSIGRDAKFSNSKVTFLGELHSIGGDTEFGDSEITSLGKLHSIGGNAYFCKSKVTSLGKLHSIGIGAYFGNSEITSLGELESIGGNADFRWTKITSLGELHSIGRDAEFGDSEIISLGKLHSIGGNANFFKSKVTSLGELESIGGNANFRDTKITSLGKLHSIGGDAYFEGSEITSLGELHSIGGEANFNLSKITSLGELQSIGGNAYFTCTQIRTLEKLHSIGGDVSFMDSEITSLGELHSIGGNAYFEYSKITSLGDIQTIGGSIVGSEELKKQYELIQKKREELKLTGQDIGQLGFEASVEDCDGADRFIKEQSEKNIGKGKKIDE